MLAGRKGGRSAEQSLGIHWCRCRWQRRWQWRWRRWSFTLHGKCTFCNELKTLSSLYIHCHFPPATNSLHSTLLHPFSHSFIHSLICCNIVARQPTMMPSNECGNRFDSNRNSKWLLSPLRDQQAHKKKKKKKETSIHLTAAHQSLKQTLTASNGICNENFFQLNWHFGIWAWMSRQLAIPLKDENFVNFRNCSLLKIILYLKIL